MNTAEEGPRGLFVPPAIRHYNNNMMYYNIMYINMYVYSTT